jgi:anti-sigma B factor antagonist
MLNYEITNIELDGNNFKSILLKEESVGLTNLNEAKSQIQNLLSDGEKNFAIDLNQVNSINSSGLGILISCLKLIKDSNGDLRLLNANDKLLNIFKITKLDKVFDLS